MDQLSKSLDGTRLRGSLLATLEFSAPWHVDFETGFGAPTHYIVDGEAVLIRRDCPPLVLRRGDLVMFPRWDSHAMRSPDARGEAIQITDVVLANGKRRWSPGDEWQEEPLILETGGGGSRTTILSMVFELDPKAPHPLLLALPRFIHAPREDIGMGPWLQPVLQFMATETAERRAGYALVSSRLADLLFMQLIRSQLVLRSGEVAGWLRGLTDPAIGVVLGALHEDPARLQSLAAMAEVARISRAAFSARFHALIGTTPFEYQRGLRLDAAAARLEQGEPVKRVAAQSGYATPYGFSAAFGRRFGLPPGRYRRNALAAKRL